MSNSGGSRIPKGDHGEHGFRAYNKGLRQSLQWGPGPEPLVWSLLVYFHTKDGPKVNDLNDSVPPCLRPTVSHSCEPVTSPYFWQGFHSNNIIKLRTFSMRKRDGRPVRLCLDLPVTFKPLTLHSNKRCQFRRLSVTSITTVIRWM